MVKLNQLERLSTTLNEKDQMVQNFNTTTMLQRYFFISEYVTAEVKAVDAESLAEAISEYAQGQGIIIWDDYAFDAPSEYWGLLNGREVKSGHPISPDTRKGAEGLAAMAELDEVPTAEVSDFMHGEFSYIIHSLIRRAAEEEDYSRRKELLSKALKVLSQETVDLEP